MGLTGAVQEGLLCLLCFDRKAGSIVNTTVPLTSYESFYRAIAEKAQGYWASFREPPGEHTLDLIDELIETRPKDGSVLDRIRESLFDSKDGLNADYLISQATTFVRQQRLRGGIMEAAELLQQDRLDDAETVLGLAMHGVLDLFSPGLRLSDPKASLAFLNEDMETFPTGIPELDRRSLGPCRKELHLFAAAPKRGKSWWLIHLGKMALLHRLKVVHVTLEMSEVTTAQRYMQSLFAVSKRKARFQRQVFKHDELGRLIGFSPRMISDRPSLEDVDIRKVLTKKIEKVLTRKPPLIIKQFPTGDLSVKQLEGYLTTLEISLGIVPDLLIVDYADLMTVSLNDYRHSLGKMYVDLRGLAVKRNMAVATASQMNRAGATSRVSTDQHIAEDYSKAATMDTGISYNQTEAERALGLARLFVMGGRNDEDRFTILISQNYGIGQFCMASSLMNKRYWSLLPSEDEEDEAGEDEEGDRD